MRVNVYAEEMTDRIQIIAKEIDGQTFTGLRIYLELPVTVRRQNIPGPEDAEVNPTVEQVRGPFMHRPGDDDSSAVTFWGKSDLRALPRQAPGPQPIHQHAGAVRRIRRLADALDVQVLAGHFRPDLHKGRISFYARARSCGNVTGIL